MINTIGGRIMATYNCLYCGTENKVRSNIANKYCTNKCQQNHRRNLRIDEWLIEGKDWKDSSGRPQWVRHHLVVTFGDNCAVCGIEEHNGKPIVLEMDHIDGNHKNNKVENLRLICPNCHSQTDTYKARNKGNGRTLNR